MARATKIGTGISLKTPPGNDFDEYFDQAAILGSFSVGFFSWATDDPASAVTGLKDKADPRGLDLHINFVPLLVGTQAVNIPAGLPQTFNDSTTRQAFKDKMMAYAATGIKTLGWAAEVNIFNYGGNAEYPYFLSLCRETYTLVKASYPNVIIWASFQWDLMRFLGVYTEALDFLDAVDVICFTSYPYDYNYAWDGRTPMPDNYYEDIRTVLPTQRIAMSEIGFPAIPRYGGANISYSWPDAVHAPTERFEEERQASFYRSMPFWFRNTGIEWISLGITYDITQFGIPTNFVGVFYLDGKVKRSYNVVKGLNFV